MRSVFGVAAALLIGLASVSAFAQETEERVIDEVVAQVNEGVITLSRVKREMKAIVDAEVEQGKDRAEAERTINEKQGELIASLINEELMLQRAKELGLDREVESAVNQQFLQVMRGNNLTTLEALYAEMRRSGVEPDDVRELWRKQKTREFVIQQEVQRKVYWEATSSDLKAYFEKNKERFTKPETVTLSEIFLSFAGRPEASVRQKAADLVAQLRGGADFKKLVTENSDRQNAAETAGSVGKLNVPDLEPRIAAAVKDVKVGGYTDPIELDQTGLTIVRVDDRTAASNESQFDENAIRMAILGEKAPEATKKFLTTLRSDAYIKINDRYRPLVAPILYADERKEQASN